MTKQEEQTQFVRFAARRLLVLVDEAKHLRDKVWGFNPAPSPQYCWYLL